MARRIDATIVQTTVKQAIDLHKRGNLDEAETRYRSVLRRQPDHPDALHFLGLL